MKRPGEQPLRIGLVCPYSFETPGGVQNHVLGLAAYLRSQGHDPHILAPGDYVPDEDDREGAGFERGHSGVDELGVGVSGVGKREAGERGGSDDRFTSAGAALAVRYNGSVARVNFGPLSAARVGRWLRRGRFDLVHIHEPVTPSISMLALWAADVPVVATFHTATPRSRSMQLAGGALRAAIEKIDAGIAVSESARKVVIQHLGRDAVVIPNGFRYEDFARTEGGRAAAWSAASAPRPHSLWRRGQRPRLSFLGRMDEPRKGLDTLLAALPQIRDGFPDLEVVLAGEGSRALPPGLRTLGIVSDREKADVLASSDVFVAPHVARESFGIVLLEAMASRTAVVASDLPAFVDILTADPGRQPSMLGATFAVGDHGDLAETVRRVLQKPDSIRTDAADLASRRYDWSVVGAAITEVYLTTCDIAGPRSLAKTALR